MLEFDGKTIVYLDELHNGATFEGEETIFDPRKNLVLKHPLIETPEGEILMGVVLKKFIRLDTDFAEESGLSLDEVTGAFIFAGKRKEDSNFEKDLSYIEKLASEINLAEKNPEIVSWVKETLRNLDNLGFIRSGKFYFEGVEDGESPTSTAPEEVKSEKWFIPTDLLLSFWPALQIEEF